MALSVGFIIGFACWKLVDEQFVLLSLSAFVAVLVMNLFVYVKDFYCVLYS